MDMLSSRKQRLRSIRQKITGSVILLVSLAVGIAALLPLIFYWESKYPNSVLTDCIECVAPKHGPMTSFRIARMRCVSYSQRVDGGFHIFLIWRKGEISVSGYRWEGFGHFVKLSLEGKPIPPSAYAPFQGHGDPPPPSFTASANGLTVGLGGAAISFLMLYCAWRTGRKLFRRHRPGTCEKCGYDLRGSPGVRCPECGSLRRTDAPQVA